MNCGHHDGEHSRRQKPWQNQRHILLHPRHRHSHVAISNSITSDHALTETSFQCWLAAPISEPQRWKCTGLYSTNPVKTSRNRCSTIATTRICCSLRVPGINHLRYSQRTSRWRMLQKSHAKPPERKFEAHVQEKTPEWRTGEAGTGRVRPIPVLSGYVWQYSTIPGFYPVCIPTLIMLIVWFSVGNTKCAPKVPHS